MISRYSWIIPVPPSHLSLNFCTLYLIAVAMYNLLSQLAQRISRLRLIKLPARKFGLENLKNVPLLFYPW